MSTIDFRVWQGGRERSLFTVKESSRDKSLILIPGTKRSDFGADHVRPIKELHVSAHTERMHGDPPRPAHKFKTTARDHDGHVFDKSVIVSVNPKGSKLLWPLTTAICGDLSDESFDLPAKSDEIVQLCAYEVIEDCLIYSVYVHDKSITLTRLQGFGFLTRQFTNLSITVFVSFVTMQPQTASIHNYHVDGTLRIDSELVTKQIGLQKSIHKRRLEEILQELCFASAAAYLASSAKLSLSEASTRLKRTADFHRWPSISSLKNWEYGELAQSKGEIYRSPTFVGGKTKPADYTQTFSRQRIIEFPVFFGNRKDPR